MASIRQYSGRWSVVLSPLEDEACQKQAGEWLDYKDNAANLFEGAYKFKLAGLRGEKAFCALLDSVKASYDYGTASGRPDEWDYRVKTGDLPPGIYSLKTQRTNSGVSQNDWVTLNARQTAHFADYYVFAYNLKNGPEVVFIGFISKAHFMRKAKALNKGEWVEARHRYSYQVKSDMLAVHASSCKPLLVARKKTDDGEGDAHQASANPQDALRPSSPVL